MPYPSQVDCETIVETAGTLIEAHGVEALSLGKLAKQLNIKAPSLYRYVESKAALMKAVNTRTVERLIQAIEQATTPPAGDARTQLFAIFASYRNFAHQHPELYMLAMTNTQDEYRPDEDEMVRLVLPLQVVMAAVSGEADSLTALRGAMALVHGFVSLELAEQFRRGGDLDAAFDACVRAYTAGWKCRDV